MASSNFFDTIPVVRVPFPRVIARSCSTARHRTPTSLESSLIPSSPLFSLRVPKPSANDSLQHNLHSWFPHSPLTPSGRPSKPSDAPTFRLRTLPPPLSPRPCFSDHLLHQAQKFQNVPTEGGIETTKFLEACEGLVKIFGLSGLLPFPSRSFKSSRVEVESTDEGIV
jgi:hypothetical protein